MTVLSRFAGTPGVFVPVFVRRLRPFCREPHGPQVTRPGTLHLSKNPTGWQAQ